MKSSNNHSKHTPAFGIDIGKETLHIAQAADTPPSAWKVITIDLTNPAWHEELRRLIPPRAVVAAEPTGYYYLAPVAAVLDNIPAAIHLVNHHVTGNVRATHISTAKTDATDARALAQIAAMIAAGTPLIGVHYFDPDRESIIRTLRIYISNRRRVVKMNTRAKNQINQVAHSVAPVLAQKIETYRTAIAAGYVTPADLHTFARLYRANKARPAGMHGRTAHTISALADAVPTITVRPEIRYAIEHLAGEIMRNDQIIDELEQMIAALIQTPPIDEISRRLLTLPLSSPYRVATIQAATHGSAHTMTRDEFVSAVGAAPKIYRSGNTDTTNKKGGYPPVKEALWLWTVALMRGDNPMSRHFHRLKQKNHPKAIYATRTKFARIMHAVANDPDGYHD